MRRGQLMPFRATPDGFISEFGPTVQRLAWAGVVFGVSLAAFSLVSASHWHPSTYGFGALGLGSMYLTRQVKADGQVLEVRLWFFKRSARWEDISEVKVDYTRAHVAAFVDGKARVVGGPLPADRADRRSMHAILRDRVDRVEVHPPSVDT